MQLYHIDLYSYNFFIEQTEIQITRFNYCGVKV